MGRLFGTDGVRGVANIELTPETALALGRAGGYFLAKQNGIEKPVIIGKDTRISGSMLEAAMIAGLTSIGLNVIKLGIITTPGVAYLTKELNALGGVMISASHNPIPDNGIKFFNGKGFKLTDAEETEIEEYLAKDNALPRPDGAKVGRLHSGEDYGKLYLAHLRQTVDVSLEGLKIVVDCANGAASLLAPELYRSLGAQVEAIFTAMDGCGINVNCGSTHVRPLQEKVLQSGANLGLAHDGDADRVIAVDEKGRIVNGDNILAICGGYFLSQDKLPGRRIAATVYSNLGLREYFRQRGADVRITDNGDRYVLEAMLAEGLILGGEQSGHIIFLEHNSTGDGLLTAIQLMQVMKKTGASLSELADELKTFPQVLKNVRVRTKSWEESRAIAESIRQVEKSLGDRGRIFVRASGTEPLIRILAEGPEQNELEEYVAQVAKVIERELNA